MSEFVTILREEQRVPKHDDITKMILREAVERIEALEAEVKRLTRERDEARAQADGLATALRELLDLVTWPPRPSGYVSAHFPATHLDAARAALAALPKEDEDADR